MPKRAGESATYAGSVVQKRVSEGSKSDRVAVLLKTRTRELILRRQGGNPFQDDVLQALVGKRIAATGLLAGNTLIVRAWEEEEGTG
jgi:hypothetical protein